MSIPTSLEECFAFLETMAGKDPERFAEFMEPNATNDGPRHSYHRGLGRQIRNEWGFWRSEGPLYRWFVSLGITHPDDMSGIIITSFWRKTRGLPLDIEGQVAKYQAYWKSVNRD